MTSQKGAQPRWGSNVALPRAPSPSMQPEGQPLHAIPPGWPGPAHWLRAKTLKLVFAERLSANALCQHNTCAQRDKSWPRTWRRCYGDVTSMHKVYWSFSSNILSCTYCMSNFQCCHHLVRDTREGGICQTTIGNEWVNNHWRILIIQTLIGQKQIFVCPAERCECKHPAGKLTMWTLCLFRGKRAWTIKLPQFKNPISIVNKIAGYDFWRQNLTWYKILTNKTYKW